jgi:hypothetical protein
VQPPGKETMGRLNCKLEDDIMTDNREINYEGYDSTGFSIFYLFMAYSIKVSLSIKIRLSWSRMDGRLAKTELERRDTK